jgi:hypothetical protein
MDKTRALGKVTILGPHGLGINYINFLAWFWFMLKVHVKHHFFMMYIHQKD